MLAFPPKSSVILLRFLNYFEVSYSLSMKSRIIILYYAGGLHIHMHT